MNRKILLVEDDRMQSEVTAGLLSGAGYQVYHFETADAAWAWLQKKHPVDLLISDVQLPGISGVSLASHIRSMPHTASVPILLLSVLGTAGHKVDGLEKGADDYLAKPFAGRELLARVEALLRRSKFQGRRDRVLSAAEIQVDLDRAEVSIRGERAELLPKEYALLVLFLENRGRVLSHRFIAEAIWGYDQPASYATLKVWISNLRKKLGPLSVQLETLTSQGYRLL